MLRRIAHASTKAMYNNAVSDLKASSVWKQNKRLQQYIEGKWIPAHQRWVRAYRMERFNVSVNTNNGIERQNRAFKYDYLREYNDRTLSGMITVIVEQYFPSSYNRYREENIKCCASFKKYNEEIPAFLQNRPREMVNHICSRYRNAIHIKETDIKEIQEGHFVIASESREEKYHVNFGNENAMPSCECHDWKRTHWLCKHFLAIFNYFPSWGWNKLSPLYRDSMYFQLDVPSEYMAASHSLTSTPSDNDERSRNHLDSENIPNANQMTSTTTTESKHLSLAVQCREQLDKLRNFTYLMKDEAVLQSIYDHLKSINQSACQHLPSDCEGGLALEQGFITKKRKRQTLSNKGRKAQRSYKQDVIIITDDENEETGNRDRPRWQRSLESLTTEDIQTLNPCAWINGSIIDFALHYHHNNASKEINSTSVIIPTTFYQALKGKTRSPRDIWKSARRQVPTDVLFTRKYILVPCNTGGHWILIIFDLCRIHQLNSSNRLEVTVLDSLGGDDGEDTAREILQFMEVEWENAYNYSIDLKDVNIRFPKVPAQKNSFDCGMFVIAYAESLLKALCSTLCWW
ncbi:sentrin-specific protease 1-like [Ptychodera flava]|uniref:sentrin-specific protease 1-like n=1 Tax=Ptychodera flava TaxID=63121 RepID=UPI003969BD8C